MVRVGLTGGVGAGKSTVADLLAQRGATVIDADAIAREIVAPGTEGLAALVDEFGGGILTARGTLDRGALAAIAFRDDEARANLNGIMHPRIAARTAELTSRLPADAVVIHDVPLLVENGLASAYDLVVVVAAPADVRLARLADRGMSADEAQRRMATQASDEERAAVADLVIDNSGTLADLDPQMVRLWERIGDVDDADPSVGS